MGCPEGNPLEVSYSNGDLCHRILSKNTMELQDILEDLQHSLNICQSRLNMIQSIQTGKLYELSVLMTRKEAAHFIKKSLRQFDRLCAEHKIKRVYIDGTVRFRKGDLLKYMGIELIALSEGEKPKSEFDRILEKFN